MAKINVLNKEITVIGRDEEDYICITDMAKFKDPSRTDYIIQNWLRNRSTIEYLGIWEQLNNPSFKPIEFDGFRKESGLNSFVLTAKQWIEKTGAIGLISKAGRYGGTFAHKDNGLSLELNTDFLLEHYYNPIILISEAQRQIFKHIIWVPSEVEFLKKLHENRNKLEKYEWWYFSKIDQTTDDVSIPYYDTKKQEYSNFFPDFIFWLKYKNKYHIKFIDPKGNVVGLGNAEDKARGFEKIFLVNRNEYNKMEVKVDLFFYNEPTGVNESVRDYYTIDFEKIFGD